MFIELTDYDGNKFMLNPYHILFMAAKDGGYTKLELTNDALVKVIEPPWRIALETEKMLEKNRADQRALDDERIGAAAFDFLRNNQEWVRKILTGEKL